MSSKPLIACAACLVSLTILGASATAAFAAEPYAVVTGKASPDTRTQIVNIADLNLASAAGEQTMRRRVGRAVGQLCNVNSPLGYYEKQMSRDCREEAWSGAEPQIAQVLQRARAGESLAAAALVIGAPR